MANSPWIYTIFARKPLFLLCVRCHIEPGFFWGGGEFAHCMVSYLLRKRPSHVMLLRLLKARAIIFLRFVPTTQSCGMPRKDVAMCPQPVKCWRCGHGVMNTLSGSGWRI
ncbi:hypothetical protein ACRRTK_024779 [Alexandromys fortis]